MARTAEVRNGEETTEEFRLATNSGLVEIITAPAGVEVFLNGKSYGKTSTTGTDAVSDPLKIDMLPAGSYTLTLTLKGYSYTPKRIQVQPNQTVALTEKPRPPVHPRHHRPPG
ncbi:MAG: PEGA domain-containing protein [Kiritimatiellia bacterium]